MLPKGYVRRSKLSHILLTLSQSLVRSRKKGFKFHVFVFLVTICASILLIFLDEYANQHDR